MPTPDNSSNISFHYIRSTSFDLEYSLLLDITKALEEILASRKLLLDTPLSTTMGEYIRPIECDQVIDLTHHIRETTTKLSCKLSLIDKEQALSNNTYFKLLMYLYAASDKSRKLDKMIQQFRPMCMESTSRQRANFTKIQREVTTFAQTCEKIEAETEGLLDSILLK